MSDQVYEGSFDRARGGDVIYSRGCFCQYCQRRGATERLHIEVKANGARFVLEHVRPSSVVDVPEGDLTEQEAAAQLRERLRELGIA